MTKVNYLSDLHKLFLVDYQSGDFYLTAFLFKKFMYFFGIKFLDKADIEGSADWLETETPAERFFEELNSAFYNDFDNFCVLCARYLDFTKSGAIEDRIEQELANDKPLFTPLLKAS